MGARAGAATAALGAAEFARLMRRLAPFEAEPRLAVAVSGGADSMALAILASHWAAAHGGSLVALTVDHGLRPEAAAEARRVKRWLAARGIAHKTLSWRGQKPMANLQAAARQARYGLLEGWCRQNGVLHLLVAHQREDQAETFLLRLSRGSGVDGLAAMAPLSERAEHRLLRPLITIPRARLRATLAALEQSWIEDPTNDDTRHARVRLRALLPALSREGMTPERLAATASQLGRARQALELATARLLAECVELDPAGYALLEPRALAAGAEDVGLRALARVIQSVGGALYAPRLERLERLYRAIMREGLPSARTLGGCRILSAPGRRLKGRLLVCREWRHAEAELVLRPGQSVTWDGRFRLTLAPRLRHASGPLRVGALGEAGWARLAADAVEVRANPLPAPVRPALPALSDLDGLLAVPHLHYGRAPAEAASVYVRSLIFQPQHPLASAGGTVA
ncbi:MAG TPA: tRNA lysidine(34) synthetase TilS [Alphaproteobacteria bacterium]|nr:tRNA lysidine(34) synthetase TilS [Alphaproteobacteria bacterium]